MVLIKKRFLKISQFHYGVMKDLSWGPLVNQYYNLNGRGDSKADCCYNDYVYCFTDEQINNSPSNLNISDEEKKIKLMKNQVFWQWTIYYDEKDMNFASELFENHLAEGLKEGNSREY